MKLYLAGPMRGYPEFNFPAFHTAAARLRDAGYEVFSPAEADLATFGEDVSKGNATGSEDAAGKALGLTGMELTRNCFLRDTEWICKNADGVALLPGWEASKGAKAERALAEAIGLRVFIIKPLSDGALALVDAKLGGH